MPDYDVIVGWLDWDGTYYCAEHVGNADGMTARFTKRDCHVCKACELQKSLDNQKDFWKDKK
jgi:predicted phosphoadenosine phosphosulfate sulfurtransferase